MPRPGAVAIAALLLLAGCATAAGPDLSGATEPGGPRPIVAAVELGEAALAQESFGEAALRFREVLRRDPGNARAKLGLGEAYLGMGAGDQALAVFNSLDTAAASEEAPPPVTVRQGKGIALLLAGKAEQSRDLLLNAVAEDPSLWRAWNALGRYYDRERQWAKAQEAYERALAANPDSAIVRNNLGFSYLSQGRHEEAVAEFTRALALNPKLEAAQTNLRLALAFQGRYAEAMAGVRQAELPRVLNNMGYVALVLGDHGRARAFFQRALEASPSFYEPAWKNLQYLANIEDQRAPAAW